MQRGQLTGNTRFADEVKHLTGLQIERRGPGGEIRVGKINLSPSSCFSKAVSDVQKNAIIKGVVGKSNGVLKPSDIRFK